ncbi:MAG: 2-oxoacid:acceptor oxidoreductase subunit alpha, partial [bacterium]
DVLVALDQDSIEVSKEQIKPDTFIIFDEEVNLKSIDKIDSIKLSIPLAKIAREVTGVAISKNMVAIGASLAIFENMDYSYIFEQIERRFSKKSQELVDKNKKAFLEGYKIARDLIISNGYKFKSVTKVNVNSEKMMLMSGNEALSMGALAAGCKYFAGYPITPASSILENMVRNIENFGGVAVQTEDEISAINSVIGAALAGVRAMTATSGPGLSLMVEGIGYAYATETPIVIANIQRGGPSTGLPTKTEDGDILMTLFMGHGDTEKIVIFPSDPYEMFIFGFEAFNLAEKYQLPVIILSDLNLGENAYTTKYISDEVLEKLKIDRGKFINSEDNISSNKILRYQDNEDGISPRIMIGTKGLQFQTSGNEHDEKGFITEDKDVRKKMVEKRMKKLSNFNEYYLSFEDFGNNPEICIISYGITYHSVKEVVEKINLDKGYSFRIIKPVVFYPFPIEKIEELIKDSKITIFVEQNYFGQLRRIYYMLGGTKKSELINKYDGEPFYFEDLYELILSKVSKYSKV